MRKTAIIAAMVMSLGVVGTPAFGQEDSDSLDDWYQEACETMLWQFDDARATRRNHPNFMQALAIRDQGAVQCEYGNYSQGSVLMRTSLQSINVNPLF